MVNTSDADIVGAFKSPDSHRGGHLEPAAAWRSSRSRARRWCSTPARSPARSSTCWSVNTETLKDNPDLGKALVGIWYETMALMADTGDKGKAAREAMAKLSGTDLAGFDAQLKTTRMFYTPKDAVDVRQQRRSCQDHGPGAHVLLRAQPAGRRRQEQGRHRHRASPPAKRWASKGNVKLRFDATFMQMAAEELSHKRSACTATQAISSGIGAMRLRQCTYVLRPNHAPGHEHRAGPRRPVAAGAPAVRPDRAHLRRGLGGAAAPQPRRQAAAAGRRDGGRGAALAFEPDRRSGEIVLWADTAASLQRLALGLGHRDPDRAGARPRDRRPAAGRARRSRRWWR